MTSAIRWYKTANLVTGLRFALALPTAAAIILQLWPWATAGFTLAVLTDLLDGPIARARRETSPGGGFFDHGTDALFVTLSLASLATQGAVTGLLPLLIPLAFTQYMLDSRALAGQSLRTSRLGRWNGIAYYVCAGIPIVQNGLELGWPPALVTTGLAWVLVLSTAASMVDRGLAWHRTR